MKKALTLLFILAASLPGCATRERLPSYFVLTSNQAGASARHTGGTRIFIRRVDMPGYLQEMHLASRRADNQIEYAPTSHWAEPLASCISDAVAEGLNSRPGLSVVGASIGGVPPSRDFDLQITIERFEGNDRGDVSLRASWTLYAPQSATPIRTGHAEIAEAGWTYGDYPKMAALLGAAVNDFSGQLAKRIGHQ
jgi:uncharacterized lipoprotein YmbA